MQSGEVNRSDRLAVPLGAGNCCSVCVIGDVIVGARVHVKNIVNGAQTGMMTTDVKNNARGRSQMTGMMTTDVKNNARGRSQMNNNVIYQPPTQTTTSLRQSGIKNHTQTV
jgi:hypothetical protein